MKLGPIKHLALRAIPQHKNYCLPKAQLYRKHLFLRRAWEIDLLPFRTFDFSTTGIVMIMD